MILLVRAIIAASEQVIGPINKILHLYG